MPLPTAQCFVTFNNISAVASSQLSTAGIALARATIIMFSLPPPNICYVPPITIFRLYTPTNAPYGIANLIISANIQAVQTPGFQASPSICVITPSIAMAQVSANLITNGQLTYYQYGLPTVIQGPPDGIVVPINSMALATSISPSGSATSVAIPSFYYPHIIVGATSTQAGAINVQRYIDVAGTIANGSALTAALSANTAAVVDSVSALGFGSFTVQITNTGTVQAAVTGLIVLLIAR